MLITSEDLTDHKMNRHDNLRHGLNHLEQRKTNDPVIHKHLFPIRLLFYFELITYSRRNTNHMSHHDFHKNLHGMNLRIKFNYFNFTTFTMSNLVHDHLRIHRVRLKNVLNRENFFFSARKSFLLTTSTTITFWTFSSKVTWLLKYNDKNSMNN